MKFIIIGGGSARLFSAFGSHHVNIGDVVVVAANTLCGAEPEGWVITTTQACEKVGQPYSDFVMLAALLAARSSEASGLQVGDVRFAKNLVVITRQIFPGKGGLVTKPTKSRKERRVPILGSLRPILERLTEGKAPEDQLLIGPKGGVLTTATVRDATNWDKIVASLGMPGLTRHGLRYTGATWMADAGVPLHVLQEILGHASMETTRGYVHPDDRLRGGAGQRVPVALRAEAPGPPRRSLDPRHLMAHLALADRPGVVLVPF